MNNEFYWAILSKPLPSRLDAMMFEIQSIENGIKQENLRRLKINGKYRIIRKISYQEVAGLKYYHKDQWIKRLKKDTKIVKEWLKRKRGKRCRK
jgi:hypothetical protein